MQPSNLRAAWVDSLAHIDREAWDALAKPVQTPFLEWDWLQLMEASGSTTAETGWIPRHLTLWSGRELVAAAPLYVKLHSAGEFVFDHAWADVAGRLGKRYYPKLIGMSPFTPMIGYRFLMAPEFDPGELTTRLLGEIEELCRRHSLSGASFHFVDPVWGEAVAERGYCAWAHQSFAWENESYGSFDDYLAGFNANQRHNIRRERRDLRRRGIHVKMIPGVELAKAHYDHMYAFYARTNDQFGPWGCKYLTRDFFKALFGRFSQRLMFAAAFEGNRRDAPVGMSLLVTKEDQLYGRYWGCSREIEFLHFDACYYAPIEWAIERGIRRFDPGMGGAHKLRRGFKAVSNHSLHRFTDPILRSVMERNIAAINRLEQEDIAALNLELPLARRQA
jgi:hypothetical protein